MIGKVFILIILYYLRKSTLDYFGSNLFFVFLFSTPFQELSVFFIDKTIQFSK